MTPEGVGSRRRSLVATAHAGAQARRELDGFAGHIEEDVIDRSRLVVTELVTNSVKHAGLGPAQRIDVGLSVSTELVRIDVADNGRGFEPVALKPDPEREGGLGLWLVDQLTDRWGVDRRPGTHVWCELDRPGRPGPGRHRRGPVPGRQREEMRRLVNRVGVLLAEEDGVASYRHAQRQALARRGEERDIARPLEFDESGFPIPQEGPRFVDRVARLLNPF